MWGADGKELFYKNGNALMVPSRYGVMKDSQRFLVTTSERVESTESPVNVILNWRGVLGRP